MQYILQTQVRSHRMDRDIEVAGTFIWVEVDWDERIAYRSKGVTFPVSYDISLHLLVAKQLDIHHYFSIELPIFVKEEIPFEEAHLIYVYQLVLGYLRFTTLRITNFRVRKVLLFPSMSEVLLGSKLFLAGLFLFSGSDLNVKNGTAKAALCLYLILLLLSLPGRLWPLSGRSWIAGYWWYLNFWGWLAVHSWDMKTFQIYS